MWEGDRTARLLEAAGIDPLELDASCLLMTDACPLCGGKGAYTVQIYRIGRSPEKLLPPYDGNAQGCAEYWLGGRETPPLAREVFPFPQAPHPFPSALYPGK